MRVPFHQLLPRCLSRCLQELVRQLLRGDHQRFLVNNPKHAGIEEEFHPCREFRGFVLVPGQDPDRRVREDLKLGGDIHFHFGNIQEPTPRLHRRANIPAHVRACGRLRGPFRHGGKRRIRPERIDTLKQASRWKGGLNPCNRL